MKYPLSELPEGADVVVGGGLATITIGDLVFRAQVTGDTLHLFPERSSKQRDFLKLMGRIVD